MPAAEDPITRHRNAMRTEISPSLSTAIKRVALPGAGMRYRVIANGDEHVLLPAEAGKFASSVAKVRRKSGASRRVGRELNHIHRTMLKNDASSHDGARNISMVSEIAAWEETVCETAAPARLSKRQRHKQNAAAKSHLNATRSEHRSRTALVIGAGAPNMPLMAGALAALEDRGATFDVVSCSGAGGLAGLLWLAPKGHTPAEALRSVTTMSVADEIYQHFPVNYKVFHKPGSWADVWRRAIAANPFFTLDTKRYKHSSPYALAIDWMLLWAATFSPTTLHAGSWGLCQPAPFLEHIIDFERLKHVKPQFYLNAYNASKEVIDNFSKEELTPEHLHAALAFPFIYGPYRLNGDLYYEGAVVDCLNFKDLVERHTGLETIVVFDVLGSETLIRAPRNLYDSWVLSMIIPLVKIAQDNLELFALKHNKGWRRTEGANADLLKIEFDVPEQHLFEVLDWSASNARRLFDIGYKSGLDFCEAYAVKLGIERLPKACLQRSDRPRELAESS